MSTARRFGWRGLVLVVTAMVLTSCGWRGIANVPLPGGPGSGKDKMTIYVQMPDTLALNVNSRVRVADVYAGSVKKIELKNWIPTLTLDLQPGIKLPANAIARIGQTSLLGTQHVELDPPPNPSPEPLRNGATIPLKNSQSFPTTERTLASIATVLRGGGIPNLDVIQTEVTNILSGNADQIRDFLGKLNTFTDQLNQQRDDLTRAIDSTNELVKIIASHNDTLDRVLTEFPPLVQYLANSRDKLTGAVEALGRFGNVTATTLSEARADLDTNLQLLQRPLKQLGKAGPYLIDSLKLAITAPYPIDNIPKVIRGDYINTSATFDLTLSSIDNAFLTGTGFSGMLRALEQAWGRDPQTMIPDVRFTPHPNMTEGGPYVERGE
ncbi:virulence factor Mce family protein [Candidatus Mycolicibacterium alkanivorans]|uniref:Virulence factor Mce family protein n=1 Tax=Candidatus Mycolicibacterium alkanivorans TaxID=2954114 RepID=A0ABS9YU20_9MYCO|nr:virulence factor Mce family protein [Candidatus Mycolicibacterium alkanivorans]MCI4673869.1 virulence factor Mce family protein [Candidatus Mycolicibacterium alkanivorans]